MTRSRTCLLLALAALAVAVLVLPSTPAPGHAPAADLLVAGHAASAPLLSAALNARVLAAAAPSPGARVPSRSTATIAARSRSGSSACRSSHDPFLDRLRI